MKLRKQLFTAFLTIALLPLIIVGFYIFATNIMLALSLHEQNLLNSTQIQADLVEENINRLMVRTKKFTSSKAVRLACRGDATNQDMTLKLSNDILNFTDETLDNVSIFALLDQNGNFLYSSGSNSDSLTLKNNLPQHLGSENQYVAEIPFGTQINSLLIYTPVQYDGQTIGSFLIVCQTDYLLKIISTHRQLESSNAFIYCSDHQEVVTSKQDFSGILSELDSKINNSKQGTLLCKLNGEQSLVYYYHLAKTPWVLVSTISTEQIFSQVWNFALINIAALIIVLFIIIILSRRQSRRILRPMDQLLGAVESFFLAGASEFPKTDIDPKTEIGYLAEKFSGLSQEMALAQGKLKESNYLYTSLLKATYEFCIVIDFKSDTLECSSDSLLERIKNCTGKTASEQLLSLLAAEEIHNTDVETAIYRIAYGDMDGPIETETCFNRKEELDKSWYRIVAVPVIENHVIRRIVLHFEDITEQKCEELRLIESSQKDSLCGVYNKSAFPLHCKLSQNGCSDAMFFIDLDNFKQVNDTLGHTAGDNVLVSTAHAIRAQFRETDVIGRFGGDEFVVFAPGISMEMARQKAIRLVNTISFHMDTPRDMEIHVTASMGVCMTTPDITLKQAIQFADQAMYQAKENGRAQFCLYQPDKKK